MLIEKTLGKIDDIDTEGKEIDRVILSHEDIEKSHQKVTTQNNRVIKISLPRDENLYCGAVLYNEEDLIICVDMPMEKVFEIKPKTNLQWAKTAYNIGNMHQRAYLYWDCICIPYDYVMESTVEALHIEFTITQRKLNGKKPNVVLSKGHSHNHSHD